jgi:hypothetical protein
MNPPPAHSPPTGSLLVSNPSLQPPTLPSQAPIHSFTTSGHRTRDRDHHREKR